MGNVTDLLSDPAQPRAVVLDGTTVMFSGAVTAMATGVVGGAVQRNRPSGVLEQTVDSRAAFVAGQQYYVTNPASGTPAVGWIYKVAAGVHAYLSPLYEDGTVFPVSPLDPSPPKAPQDNGETYQVRSLETVAVAAITVTGSGIAVFQNVRFTKPLSIHVHGAVQVLFVQCSFDALVSRPLGGQIFFSNCYFAGGIVSSSTDTLIFGGVIAAGPAVIETGFVDGDTIVNTLLEIPFGGFAAVANVCMGAGNRVLISGTATVVVETLNDDNDGPVWWQEGGANAVGVTLEHGSRLFYTPNRATPTAVATFVAVPTFTANTPSGARTMGVAFDDTAQSFTSARAMTPANLDASIGAGGFAGAVHVPNAGVLIARTKTGP